jgi:hypothetical protein
LWQAQLLLDEQQRCAPARRCRHRRPCPPGIARPVASNQAMLRRLNRRATGIQSDSLSWRVKQALRELLLRQFESL